MLFTNGVLSVHEAAFLRTTVDIYVSNGVNDVERSINTARLWGLIPTRANPF